MITPVLVVQTPHFSAWSTSCGSFITRNHYRAVTLVTIFEHRQKAPCELWGDSLQTQVRVAEDGAAEDNAATFATANCPTAPLDRLQAPLTAFTIFIVPATVPRVSGWRLHKQGSTEYLRTNKFWRPPPKPNPKTNPNNQTTKFPNNQTAFF